MTLDALLTRIYNTPWFVSATYARSVMSVLARRAQGERLSEAEIEVAIRDGRSAYAGEGDPHAAALGNGAKAEDSGYTMTPDGVAVIAVRGALVKRTEMKSSSGDETSYEEVQEAAELAFADPMARAVMLDIDSPGGQVDGCFELCGALRTLREATGKPLGAYADGCACSAAYAIGAVADPGMFSAAPSAVVGSIGVYMITSDESEMWGAMGVKHTVVQAGAMKTIGLPLKPMSDDERAFLQKHIDESYASFVAHVAAERGLSEEAVRATEAGFFNAPEGVRIGLIDAACTFDEAIDSLATSQHTTGAKQMARLTNVPKGGARAALAAAMKNNPGPKANADPGDETDPVKDPEAPMEEEEKAGAEKKPAAAETPAEPEKKDTEDANAAASIADLEAAFPMADANFLLAQVKAKATLIGAAKAYGSFCTEQVKTARAEADAAKKAAIDAGRGGNPPALTLTPGASPAGSTRFAGASGTDPAADYDANEDVRAWWTNKHGSAASRAAFIRWGNDVNRNGGSYLAAMREARGSVINNVA